MDSSNADGALFRESSARMNKALNDVARERDDALKALAESRARFADSEARRAELEATAEYLAEAIRLTQEYVGPEILPPIEGWSWYDALAKYRSLPRSVVLEDRDRAVAEAAIRQHAQTIAKTIAKTMRAEFQDTIVDLMAENIALKSRAAAIRKGEAR